MRLVYIISRLVFIVPTNQLYSLEEAKYNREYKRLEKAINRSSKAWARYFHISARNKQRIEALLKEGKRHNDEKIRELRAKTRLAWRRADQAAKKADPKPLLEAKARYEISKTS